MDINMPKKNGFQTCHEIKQIFTYENLSSTIISTSANDDIEDGEKEFGSQFDYSSKKFA